MYIYIIMNKINGKKYVGQTTKTNPMKRVNEHFQKDNGSIYLYNAIQKYGKDNFDVEVIPYLGASQKALDEIERWQIKKNNSLSPNGYNLKDGGRGGKLSNETKRKLSEIMTGRKFSKEHKKLISENTSKAVMGKNNHMYGKHHSDETKQKLRKSMLGKPGPNLGKKFSEETKKKMRESQLQRNKNN